MSKYLTQLIIRYAQKYVQNIEANLRISLWGGDVLLVFCVREAVDVNDF